MKLKNVSTRITDGGEGVHISLRVGDVGQKLEFCAGEDTETFRAKLKYITDWIRLMERKKKP